MKVKIYIIVLFMFLCFFVMPCVMANESSDDDSYEISNMNSAINDFIKINNLDVPHELDNIVEFYENYALCSRNEETIRKALDLADEARYLKSVFLNSSNNSRESMYSNAITAAATYFSTFGYDLAEELILHFGSNTNLDSTYNPIYGDKVLLSSVYNSICNSNIKEGSDEFPNSGNTNDKDLYNAIHNFKYFKSASNRAVIIQDRYDFDPDDSYGLTSSIISILVAGQDAGYLLPFYTVIEHTYSGTSQNQSKTFTVATSDRIFEDVTTLSEGEMVDYYITFPYGGEKVIQTFGTKDTYLYVYEPNGQIIDANDDGGYMLNAFLNCNLEANVQYKIRIILENSDDYGIVKLSITWPDGIYSSGVNHLNYFSQIYSSNSNSVTLNNTMTLHHAKFIVYHPQTTEKYVVATYGNYDTYLYIIDPRSTYRTIGSKFENDDGGTNYNAYIATFLAKNIDYLIIFSHYSMSLECSFYLTVDLY